MTNISIQERFALHVELAGEDECWTWKGHLSGRGYGKFRGEGGTASRYRGAHVMAWELANGRPVPPGTLVCHHCDNPPCVNPAHLFLGAPTDNMQDMIKKGRQRFRRGADAGAAKLTEDQVREIRGLLDAGHPQRGIASEYGVQQMTISHIATGRSWGWLT